MHFSYYENKTCSEENVHSVKKEKKNHSSSYYPEITAVNILVKTL